MIKTCKNCGIQFDARTTWQEFHSDACRIEYFRKMKKAKNQPEPGTSKKSVTRDDIS